MAKSSFITELEVSPQESGKRWKVKTQFTYERRGKSRRSTITVPAGFLTDFASFPLWRFFFWWLPYWAKYNKAAVLHDYLYQIGTMLGQEGIPWIVTREIADRIFHEAMLVAFRHHRSGRVVARLEFWGVRIGGWMAYRRQVQG